MTDSAATVEGFAPGETLALRPGLRLPDWSVLEDAAGRAALAASMAVAGRRRKWAGLGAEEDAVRRTVLHLFAILGSGPDVAEVAAAQALPAGVALDVLRSLQRRDLLLLNAAEAQVAACYPFSAAPTPHRVMIGGERRMVHALCAIDALGIGGMLGAETEIQSRCAHCGAVITIRLSTASRRLVAVEPRDAIVWSGTRYAGGCSATSGCALKTFFCSEGHLEAWRAATDPDGPGFRLSIDAARQVGLALFGPMLGASPH